jgi:hypothetical protein
MYSFYSKIVLNTMNTTAAAAAAGGSQQHQ